MFGRVLATGSLVIVCSTSFAQSVSIPLNVLKKPAADLLSPQGRPLDVGQAASLAQQGHDLSILNPADNRLWQNKKYPAQESASGFPDGAVGVRWMSFEAQLPFTSMSRVRSMSDGKFYRFSLSRWTHTTLMRAALLRKLGYFVPSPKYYRTLRVFFANAAEKQEFLRASQEAMISDFESRGWVAEDDTKNNSLLLRDAVLEVQTADYFDVHWGFAPDPNHPAQRPVVELFSRNRAFRALILPYALVDVPESVNRYSPKFGSVLSGHVVVAHPSADAFQAVAIEDVRWLARRLAQLQETEFMDIVKAGAFPQELEGLIYAKLLHRVRNALELFGVSRARSLKIPSLDITTAGGLVKNGKVTREFVPGYPQRFAHGDREEPFREGDFERYLGTRVKSSVIGTALAQLNQRLQLLSIGDLAQKRQGEIRDRVLNHIKTKPWEPLYQKVEAWGGPVGGLNLNAARHLTTGTYYGSNAAIQMVDNLSVQAALGWFVALDGIPRITPTGMANVSIVRDYTHVRPLLSLEEGSRSSWNSLVVPHFMRNLAAILDSDKLIEKDGAKKHPLDSFLSELRENEVFTVTDSVATAASLGVSTSFDILLGLTPLSFLNSVSLSGDSSRIILRQVSIMRTRDGVQIFVRNQKTQALGMNMDVDYFVNLVKVRAQTAKTDLKTDAFVIDYNPEYAELVDQGSDKPFVKEFIETRKNLQPALSALFKNNAVELLYSRFPYKKFEIDHQLKTKELRAKVLIWKSSAYDEDHLLKIRYPRSADFPELDPKDEEIVLFANKRGEMKGRDWLGFITSAISALLGRATKVPVSLSDLDDPNPANVPYGSAQWRIVGTERDLSPNPAGGKRYPDVAVLQHVWGGWKLKRNDFMKLIDDIQAQFAGTKLASYRLIEKEAFSTVKSVDFYRITANLSVLPSGLARIRDLILQPDAAGKPAPKAAVLLRMAQKLSEKLSGHRASAVDKELYLDLMTILGNGNTERGMGYFTEMCEAMHGGSSSGRNTGGFINGTWFDCMTPWLEKLLNLARSFPSDKQEQVRWMTRVLWVLDEHIPMPQLLRYIGEKNFIFLVRINGFRTGDEDGDLEFFSNTIGDPEQNLEYANGLIGMFATKTRLSPIELDRTQGGFR